MKRPHSGTDALDPRRRYDTEIWASRRSNDGEGGATQPEPKPGEGEPERHAEKRQAVSLGEPLMPLESLSIEELQRELDRRQGELKRMVSRRDRLARQLAELDAQIRALGGDGGTPRGEGRRLPSGHGRPKRTRSKNEITLSDAIALAVEVRATVTPTEVAQLVQANGYQSTSKNFAMMVANALAKDKRFRRLSRGQYERIS